MFTSVIAYHFLSGGTCLVAGILFGYWLAVNDRSRRRS